MVTDLMPGADFIDLQSTFTMTGEYRGYSNSALTGTPVFTLALTGSGAAFIGPLRRIDAEGHLITSQANLVFRFAETSPTPEPTTTQRSNLTVRRE